MWFTACVMLAVGGFFGYRLWTIFGWYDGYGLVTGRVIALSAPWDGTVHGLGACEGSWVESGQIVAEIANMDLEQRLDRARDDLRMAEAELRARLSLVQWQADIGADGTRKVDAEYLAAWGELLAEDAALADLRQQEGRAESLSASGSVSEEQVESLKLRAQGQLAKVDKLRLSVEALRERAEMANRIRSDSVDRFDPGFAKLQCLKAEIERLRTQLDRGKLTAPVAGRVVRRHAFAGEAIREAKPLFEICEAGSLRITLYIPQSRVEAYPVGRELKVWIPPSPEPWRVVVSRIGESLESPPASLRRYFTDQDGRIPVECEFERDVLENLPAAKGHDTLRIGFHAMVARKGIAGWLFSGRDERAEPQP